MLKETLQLLLLVKHKRDMAAFTQFVAQEKLPYDYVLVNGITEAGKQLRSKRFDVVISDLSLPDGTLVTLSEYMKSTPKIGLLDKDEAPSIYEAVKKGVTHFLMKDPEGAYLKELPELLNKAMEERQARDRLVILDQVLQDIGKGVCVTDDSGCVIEVNKTFCDMYGYDKREVLGKSCRDILPNNETEFRDDRAVELHQIRKDGSGFPASIRQSMVGNPAEHEHAIIYIVNDLTDYNSLQKAVQEAQDASEKSMNFRKQFLSSMNHEIRTPLNAIVGMAELTLDSDLTSEHQQYLEVIKSSSEALLMTINNLLDFARIETGQMQIEETQFDLRELLESVASTYNGAAVADRLELLCHVDPGLPTWVLSDPTRLRQIFSNIVNNAIKLTQKGEIRIEVDGHEMEVARGSEFSKYGYHFRVIDTGIGITEGDRARIFENNPNLGSSHSRLCDGMALGLSLSNILVRVMGGKIWLDTEEGKGSVFHVLLELPAITGPETTAEWQMYEDARVLIVDDNQSSRRILKSYLSFRGPTVVEAANGQQALSILQEQDDFDLILIDHHMPEMDGVELSKKIITNHPFDESKIVLLLRDHHLEAAPQDDLVTKFIGKPIKQSELMYLIQDILPAGAQIPDQGVLRVEALDNTDSEEACTTLQPGMTSD